MRDTSNLKIPVSKPTKNNDLKSRAVINKPKEKVLVERPLPIFVKTSAEIFKSIHQEKAVLQSLPKRKGNLKVQILSRSLKSNELK